ncbi:hypothetical protein K32_13040 [Kaistia sp. 32K]|nr:hypothetical protein K32_13040 [Kaistia sp. 32K]
MISLAFGEIMDALDIGKVSRPEWGYEPATANGWILRLAVGKRISETILGRILGPSFRPARGELRFLKDVGKIDGRSGRI